MSDFLLIARPFQLDQSLRASLLMIGIVALISGILMMLHHRGLMDQVYRNEKDERIRLFEIRKFRRRGLVSAMVSSVGCMMGAMYWAVEARPFAILLMLVMTLLLGILGLALLDIVSVGLNSISKPDDTARQELVKEVLRRREQQASEEADD